MEDLEEDDDNMADDNDVNDSSREEADGDEQRPAQAQPNAGSGWRLNDTLEIRVAAMNLLDLHYRTFGSGLSAPGRNLRLTATAQF